MCGIAGFLSPNGVFSETDLCRMTQRLSHRGPDAQGTYADHGCGLGHRRLSILDLSARANQPMVSHCGRYVMVYNGEVYNYRALAAQLTTNSPTWQTTSDSEVILELFARQGPDFVHALNGMFALAIFDQHARTLHLFRDRLGIKPLYYFWDGQNLAFASELKALLAVPFIPRRLDRVAVGDFLRFGYVPAPQSVYQGIYKLPPATWLTVSARAMEIQTWWQATDEVRAQPLTDEREATAQLDALLYQAVRDQLVSDVPLGVFLSGGIDSSLVAAQAVRASPTRLDTFSIGFREARYNELPHARAVADHLGTRHHELLVLPAQAHALVEQLPDVYDEPFADSSAIPTLLVSQLARQHGTVSLSGDGGDELFMGYGTYQWAQRLHNPWLQLARQPVAHLLGGLRGDAFRKAQRMLRYPSASSIATHIFTQENGFFDESTLQNELFADRQYATPSVGWFPPRPVRPLAPAENQALFDLDRYLPDDLLTKVDRASMHHGLEVRVPLLDQRLVAFALNLSPSLKVKGGERKYLLKRVLYQHLPAALFDRPKRGFAVPLREWLRTDLAYLLDDYLGEATVTAAGVVSYPYVRQLVTRFRAGEEHLYNRVWLLLVLHQFLRKHHLAP